MSTTFGKKRQEATLKKYAKMLAAGQVWAGEQLQGLKKQANANIEGKSGRTKEGDVYTADQVKEARALLMAMDIAKGAAPPTIDYTKHKGFGVVIGSQPDAVEASAPVGNEPGADGRVTGKNPHAPSGAAGSTRPAKPVVQGSGPKGPRQRRSVSDAKVIAGQYGDEIFATEAMKRDLTYKERLKAEAKPVKKQGKGKNQRATKKAGGQGVRDLLSEAIDAQINNVVARKVGAVPDFTASGAPDVRAGYEKNLRTTANVLSRAVTAQKHNPVAGVVGRVTNPGSPEKKPDLSDYGFSSKPKTSSKDRKKRKTGGIGGGR